jgi:hypothetical protein
VLESKVLRKVFGPYRNKITESWRKLHIEEFMTYARRQELFGWATGG